MTLTFTAYGKPEPQGSAKAFIPKGWTRAVITSDNLANKTWRRTVAVTALEAVKRAGWPTLTGAVALEVAFYLPRPQRLKARPDPHTTRPDLDKLARSIADALSGIVYGDDGQVTALTVRKAYAEPDGRPRAEICVQDAR